MTTPEAIRVSRVDVEEYEPFVLDGARYGDVHWLRTESAGEGVLETGLWRASESMVIPYTFPGDETIHVLEGEAHIELEGGETIDLKAGDIASFPKGLVSTRTVRAPWKDFFVVSG
jgi:hypothetical protein